MRMRKKKNLGQRMERCANVLVSEPQALRGQWRAHFGRDLPLCVEIGCGKGRFIVETARREPDKLFLAIEREEGALIMALEKVAGAPLDNLLFLSCDAESLTEIFAEGEVSRVYLNFSDPWPPKKQAKRRLTHPNFLKRYDEILAPGGELFFKTDNQKLFEYSIAEIANYGFVLSNVSLDLHQSEYDNIMTEYEEKFSSQGMRIYRLEGKKKEMNAGE